MHSTHFLSINLLGLIVTILGILILVGLFSSKRALMAMVLLAGLGLIVFLVGALFLSVAGLRRGPAQPQPYVYLEPSQPTIVDTLADTNVVLLGDEKRNRLSVEIVNCDEGNSVCQATVQVVDEDTGANGELDAEDVWSEDPQLAARIDDQLKDGELKDDEPKDVVGKESDASLLEPAEAERPSWIYEDLQVTREPHRITVSAGPHQSWKEVDRATDEALERGLKQYAEWYLTAGGHNLSTEIRADELQVSLPRLRECVVETFDYLHESPSMTMSEMPMRYILLEFDKDFRKRVLEPSWNRSRSIARSKRAGTLAGGVLALLAAAFGLLKIDSATGGKRRRALTTAGIVAGAAGTLTLIGMIR